MGRGSGVGKERVGGMDRGEGGKEVGFGRK